MRQTLWLSVLLPLAMGFVGMVLAQLMALPAMVGAQEARIRAEQFAVVGENGVDRVRLQTGPGVASFVQVLDADGTLRAVIGTGGRLSDRPASPGFNLTRSDGRVVGRLGTGDPEEGIVTLHLRDGTGQDRVRLHVAEDGTPSMQLLDANGNVTWSAR